MKTLRRYRTSIGAFLTALVAIWQICSPMNLSAATYYWDADANGINGVLGGAGTWDTSSLQWDPDAADNTDNDNVIWSNLGNNTAVFSGTGGTVTLGAPITAGGLTFNTTGYILTGSTLTLNAPAGFTSPVIAVNNRSFGSNRAIIDSIIAGTSGLTKTGNGSLVLTNNANSFSGDTSIKQGQLIVTNAAQLGTGTTAISITGIAGSGNPGYSGGSLVLQGAATSTSGAGITLNREVSVSGRGPGAVNNTGGLVSIGYNTLAGGFTFGTGATESRVWATHGATKITSDVFLGAGGAQIFQGNGNWIISGRVSGTDTGGDRLLKTGQIVSTTLWLQNATNNFLSTARIDSGTVRVADNGALGLNTSTSAVDLNGGTLEIRTDAPNFSTRKVNVRGDITAGIFADRAIGGSQINQTVSFSDSILTRNSTFNISGRNGYNVTIASLLGGNDNNNTLSNNSNGLLTITGNLWGTGNGTVRTYTFSGNGDSLIGGNIIASGAAHNFTKSGRGVLTILGTAATYTGNTTIGDGTLAIRSFGAINATSGVLNIGNGTTTSGALSYLGAAGTGAGETVTKAININTTTSNDVIFANQSGTAPTALVISGTITALDGNKILYLGGANYQNGIEVQLDNEITSALPDTATTGGANTLSLGKTGTGTWVLSNQNNLYEGTTSIYGGTLKLKATAGGATSIIKTGGAVTFAADTAANTGWMGTQTAAGTLQYDGFSSGGVTSNTQALGALSVTAGAATVLINPGTNNSVTLTFASLVAPSAGTGLNFVVPVGNTVQITGASGFLNAHAYYNGSDFAFAAGAGGTLRAPVYDTDASFVTAGAALTAASHNLVTAATDTGALTISSLKISGGQTVNQTGLLTIQTAANSAGGIIQTGGAGTISGTGVTTGGSGDLVIRVNGSSDSLNLSAPITSTTTGGLTKNGAGTLTLNGVNAYTGATTINEGTLVIGSGSRLGGGSASNNNNLAVRQGATLDVGGNAIGVGAFNGAGTITNNGAATVLTIGNNDQNGTFSGMIKNGSGTLGITKTGTGTTMALTGVNTYTGVTTLSGGTLAVTSLANIGVASGIGMGIATNNTTNAASLVFNGGTLQYTGANATIFQTTQTPSVSIDRLFTLAGNGTIDSSGSYGANFLGRTRNDASLIFNNTADIAFSGAGARMLTLTGDSIGDNELDIHLIDNGGSALSFTKAGGGLWILKPSSANTYTGVTTVSGGALRAADGMGLSSFSNLTLSGGVFEVAGSTTFTRALGTGAGQVQLTGGASGFSNAGTDRLVVTLGGGDLTWGTTAGFLQTSLVLGSSTALGETEFTNNINLGSSARTVTVTNNGNTGAMVTAGILSGVISGATGGNLLKTGTGVLMLGNANTYAGNTNVRDGTLVVSSIGASGATATSVGTNVSGGALQLGNPTTTTTANLIYVGAGETTTRAIQLIGTTGTRRIDSSGSGALVLTSLAVTEAGAKTLELRGSNTDNNMITSVIADNGILSITKNDGGVWILNPTGTNSFTGAITLSGGLLGLTANGIGNASTIALNNGGIFAYGGALTSTVGVSGNNSTAIFAGQDNITIEKTGGTAVTKTSGNNQWTISNNLENGAVLTINGDFVNNEAGTTAATQTISIRGMGSTIWNGALTENAAAGGKIAWSIAIANDASFTMSGAANTYTGSTTLTQGTLILNKSLGATSGLTWNGGVIQAGVGLSLNTAITLATDPVAFSGTNSIDLTAATALVNSGGNRLLMNNITGPASLTVTGNINLTNDTTARTLNILGSGNTTVNGVVQNGGGAAGSLTYSGTGSLTLTATNTATGVLTVNRGTVVLGGANGSWNSTGNTFLVNSGGTLRLDNSGTENANRLLDGGAITIAGGTLDFIGDGNGTSESLGALTLGGVATSKITMSGVGPNMLTFASVSMPNTGSSLNLGSITGLGSTNKVIFTTSTGLNVSNNVISRVFVGGNDFATYDGNGVGLFSAYNNGNNLNTAAATDTMNLTANATISANRTINALKINGSGLTVGSANGNTLTVTAAGVLNTGGNNTIAQSVLAFGGTVGYFQVQTGTQLEVTGVMTGSNGFAKAGGGTLLLSTPSSITSTTNVLDGTLKLNGGLNTLNANQILNVQLGGTLDLNGNTQYVAQIQAPGVMPNTGGTITTSVGTSTLVTNMAGGTTFAGQITGNVNFGRVAGNTLTLESAQTYTGMTVLMGGTTALENDAALTNTSSIDLNYATLSLNNNSSLQTQNNNRINDAAAITMRGGTLNYTGRVSTVASETFGALNLSEGANTITATTTITATSNISGISSVDLNFGAFTRSAGATINFTGTNLGQQGNNSRIMFASAPAAVGSGVLGAWAIANTTDYAAYNAGTGVGVVGQGGYAGYSSQVISAASTAQLAGVFASGNITSITATANSSLQLGGGTTTTSLLRIAGGFTTDVNFTNSSDVLHLELGGILRSNNNNNTTIGTTATRGIITSGINELVVYNAQGTTTINSIIQGATQLIKSGGGTLTLTAANTYSLGTVVNQGTLNLSPTNPGDLVAGTGSTFIINGGVPGTGTTVNVNAAGALSAGTNLTINGRGTINFANSTTNTINSLTINNNGGEGNPTVNIGTGSVLNITSSTITATSSNAATTGTISGGTLALAAGTNTFNIDAIKLGAQNYIATQTTLNISSTITGSGVNFTKTGAGILQLSGANTFTGPIAVNSGILRAGVASVANVSGAFGVNNAVTLANTAGVAIDIAGFNTQIGSLAGGGALGGNVILGANFLTTGANDTSTSFAGAISGTGGLIKIGTGTQTLSGVHTYTGTTTLSGGTLKLDYGTNDSSKLSDTAALTLGGGTLEISGGAHNEVVVSTTLTAGTANTITRTNGGTGILQLNAIAVGAGATLNFVQGSIATTDTTNTNGILGGWATVGGTNFATNQTNGTDGLIVAFSGYFDVTRLSSGTKSITNVPANNVRIVEGAGTLGDITLAAATTVINTLAVDVSTMGPATINPGASETLRLGVAGGVLLTATSGELIIGTASGDGNLSAGGSAANTAGTINFSNFSTTNNITVNSAIINNGSGAVSMTKQGAGKVVLNGTNTATGTIAIAEGTLQMGAAGSITAAGALTINAAVGATAVLDVNGRDVTTGAITLGGATSTSTANILNTAGGGTMTVNGNVTYSATNNPLGSTIAANLNLGSNVERTFAVGDSTTAATDLTVSGSMTGTGTTGILKDGVGTLALSGANTYTGTTTVRDGILALQGGAAIEDTAEVHIIGNNASNSSSSIGITATLRVDNDEIIGALTGNGNVNILATRTLTVDSSVTTVFNGGFTGAGTFKKTGTGTIELGGTSTGVIKTEIAGGTALLRNPNALGAAGSQATFADGTTMAFNNTGFIGLRTTLTTWTSTAAPTLATAGAMVVTSAERTFGFGSDPSVIAREMGNNTGWIYTSIMNNPDATGAWTFSEHFDDNAYLKLNGTQILSNTQYDYLTSAAGTVNSGNNDVEIRIANGGGGVGPVNNPGATAPVNGANWTAATPSPFGIGYSSYTTVGDKVQSNYTGFGVTITGPEIAIGTPAYNGGIVASFKAYTDAHVAADINLGGTVTVNTSAMVDATDRVFLDGVIKDAPASTGNLIKTGSRTLILTGDNTYTGTTTISQGNLQVGNGGIGKSGTGDVQLVAASSVLSGTGTVQGATTVDMGSVRAGDLGGALEGTLNFSSDLTFNHAASTNAALFGIQGTTTANETGDQINVTGALNMSASSNFLVTNGAAWTPTIGQSWTLMNWVGLLTLNGWDAGPNLRDGSGDNLSNLNLVDISASGLVWNISDMIDGSTGGSLTVSIVMIPEPSRMLLLMFGLMALIFRRRRSSSALS